MFFFKNLQEYKNVVHGILERKDGSINPFSNPRSEQNILQALKHLGYRRATAKNLVFAEQVHGAGVSFVSSVEQSAKPESSNTYGFIESNVDGLITGSEGQILIIKTADCLPILMYDSEQNRVAAVHAGREGLIKGIIKEAVGVMETNCGKLIVDVGPHIRKCCYYLRGESKRYAKDDEWRNYVEKKEVVDSAGENKYYFDLTQIALDQLKGLGVAEKNIEDCGICTFCEAERFFSARRQERQTGIYKEEKEKIPCFGSFIGLRQNSPINL